MTSRGPTGLPRFTTYKYTDSVIPSSCMAVPVKVLPFQLVLYLAVLAFTYLLKGTSDNPMRTSRAGFVRYDRNSFRWQNLLIFGGNFAPQKV
jgi:hypothetical protein